MTNGRLDVDVAKAIAVAVPPAMGSILTMVCWPCWPDGDCVGVIGLLLRLAKSRNTTRTANAELIPTKAIVKVSGPRFTGALYTARGFTGLLGPRIFGGWLRDDFLELIYPLFLRMLRCNTLYHRSVASG